MHNDPITKYYNEIRTDYGVNSLRKRKVQNLVRSELKNGRTRILDLGCAGGYMAEELRELGANITGLDISEKSVLLARETLDNAVVLDIERDEWPKEFLSKSFDIVICAELIEHLFNQDVFLYRIKEVLNDDGRLIITTPNFLTWNNRIRMLFGQYGPKEILYDLGHIHLLSYNGLVEKIAKAGFIITTEDHVWYPNKLERWKRWLSPNLFVFQSIITIKINK